MEASLDAWLTTGRFAAQFEREFAAFMGVRCASLVNSGSSANLVALSCLTSPSLGERTLSMPGDEVITVAAGFPNHGQSNYPERTCPGVCRRSDSNI